MATMYTYSLYSPYLMHHGIKGQKWGVRRTPSQLGYGPTTGQKIKRALTTAGGAIVRTGKKAGSTVVEARKRHVEDEKRRISAKKPLWQLSDAELKERISRMDLEKQYKQRLDETGRTTAKQAVIKICKDTAFDLSKQTAKYFGGKLINNMFGEEVINLKGNNNGDKKKGDKNNDKKEQEKKKSASENKSDSGSDKVAENREKFKDAMTTVGKSALKATKKAAKAAQEEMKRDREEHERRFKSLPSDTRKSLYDQYQDDLRKRLNKMYL